jgi:hypothetical protein
MRDMLSRIIRCCVVTPETWEVGRELKVAIGLDDSWRSTEENCKILVGCINPGKGGSSKLRDEIWNLRVCIDPFVVSKCKQRACKISHPPPRVVTCIDE